MLRERLFTSIATGLLAVAATGCGWHLRGSTPLPANLATTYIATEDEYTDFYRELRQALLAAGVDVSDHSDAATAVVRIRSDLFGQRITAVSARNTPEEYQVFYGVDYSLDVRGAEALPVQHVELSANYSYDTTLVLAKQREQHGIQLALARELANQVVRRLAIAKPVMQN